MTNGRSRFNNSAKHYRTLRPKKEGVYRVKKLRTTVVLGAIGTILAIAWPILRATRASWLDRLGYDIKIFDAVTIWPLPIVAVLFLVAAGISFISYKNATRAAQEVAEREELERHAALSETIRPAALLEAFRHDLAHYIGGRSTTRLPAPVLSFCHEIADLADAIDVFYDTHKRLVRGSGGDRRTGMVSAETAINTSDFGKVLDKSTEWLVKNVRPTVNTVVASRVVPSNSDALLQEARAQVEAVANFLHGIPEAQLRATLGEADKVMWAIDLYHTT